MPEAKPMYAPAYPSTPFDQLRHLWRTWTSPRRQTRARGTARAPAFAPRLGLAHLAMLSAVITAGLYAALPFFDTSAVGQMLQRSAIQPLTVAVALLGLLALAQRFEQGRRERRYATALGQEDWPAAAQAVEPLRGWYRGLSIPQGWAMTRLRRLIEATASGEAASVAAERLAQADRQMLQDRYQLPRALASALPMLGLAGTVWGLSDGMRHLAGIIGQASDIDGLRALLTGFSGSLATAFDATLLALMLLAPLLVLMATAQRLDGATLDVIDRQCERLVGLIAPPRADRAEAQVVREAAGRVAAALEAGIGGALERMALRPAGAVDPNLLQALAELPRALEAVRVALADPRLIEVRVLPPDAGR